MNNLQLVEKIERDLDAENEDRYQETFEAIYWILDYCKVGGDVNELQEQSSYLENWKGIEFDSKLEEQLKSLLRKFIREKSGEYVESAKSFLK